MEKHRCPYCGCFGFYLYKLDGFKIVPRCMDCENVTQEGGWHGILGVTGEEYQSSPKVIK